MGKTNYILTKVISYIYINRWKLVFLIPIYLLINFFSSLPYISLALSFENKLILFWILAVIILKASYKSTIVASLVLIIFSLTLIIRDRIYVSEQMGVVIVALLFIAFLQKNLSKTNE